MYFKSQDLQSNDLQRKTWRKYLISHISSLYACIEIIYLISGTLIDQTEKTIN